MALTQSMTLVSNFNTEVNFQDCYIKVISLEGGKAQIKVQYGIHKEQGGLLLTCGSTVFAPDLNGVNFIAQAYEHLKTLPEFEGATDC